MCLAQRLRSSFPLLLAIGLRIGHRLGRLPLVPAVEVYRVVTTSETLPLCPSQPIPRYRHTPLSLQDPLVRTLVVLELRSAVQSIQSVSSQHASARSRFA